uniref:Sema domain-containing protein n=1 Tax=Trichuris muris TaxID=70415 RepID=A0A5S6R319_TRIMR
MPTPATLYVCSATLEGPGDSTRLAFAAVPKLASGAFDSISACWSPPMRHGVACRQSVPERSVDDGSTMANSTTASRPSDSTLLII